MTSEKKTITQRFFESHESSIFVIGSLMLIAWVCAIAALRELENPVWNSMLQMGLTHVFGGRASSIATGLSLDTSRLLTALFATYLDVMMLMIIYPILIFSHRNLLERRFYRQHMQPIFDVAQKSIVRMRGFKIVGIFLFVWFPLWMTGIIAGAVIGYLLGLRTWVTMTTVILGTASAILSWVFVLGELFDKLSASHRMLPMAFTLFLIALLLILRFRSMKARAEAVAGGEPGS